MKYTVSFWARADRPGPAIFAWTAYRAINPFADAPSPGSFRFQGEREWKEFTFAVREAEDFGEYTLAPELETAIRDLRLPMTRFYGVGDEPFGVEAAIVRRISSTALR
jgi:hypothetical protein